MEAANLLGGLQVEQGLSASMDNERGAGEMQKRKGKRPENAKARRIREFLERKNREREEREAAAGAAEMEKGEEWEDMATDG